MTLTNGFLNPALSAVLLLMFSTDINEYFRAFFLIVWFGVLIFFIYAARNVISITDSAHEPYNSLHSLIANQTVILNVKHKLKIESLIAKLSESTIGLPFGFPFPNEFDILTSLEFFKYLLGTFGFFALLKGFI